MKGIAVSEGFAIGTAFVVQEMDGWEKDHGHASSQHTFAGVEQEKHLLHKAVEISIEQIELMKQDSAKEVGEYDAQVFEAHRMIMTDPALMSEIERLVEQQIPAIEATQTVILQFVELFESMDDPYMRERAIDLQDVSTRLLHNFAGTGADPWNGIRDASTVVVARNLTPSDTLQLHSKKVAGFITEMGGKSSHTAILARSLGIPAIVGVSGILDHIKTGNTVIIDGFLGKVVINPKDRQIKSYREKSDRYLKDKESWEHEISLPCITLDGHPVELASNVGDPIEAEIALKCGAEAVGLFRTELFFMNRKQFPSEEEQVATYRRVAEIMGGKPVVIRTLDVGGDKELPYLPIPHETNPFMGKRGIRFCLENKKLFQSQLRAILRASVNGKIKVMYPMISNFEELCQANNILEEVKASLSRENIPYDAGIEVGMMVEVPSVAISPELFVDKVDFFSVGGNDLIQFTFAVDRTDQRLTYLYQHCHPSILKLIQNLIRVAHKHGKWVGVCGEMAGDLASAYLLLGLGVDELSMSTRSIHKIKSMLRHVTYCDAKEFISEVIGCRTHQEVVDKTYKRLEIKGVGLR